MFFPVGVRDINAAVGSEVHPDEEGGIVTVGATDFVCVEQLPAIIKSAEVFDNIRSAAESLRFLVEMRGNRFPSVFWRKYRVDGRKVWI